VPNDQLPELQKSFSPNYEHFIMYLKLFKTSYPSFEEGRLGASLAWSLGYCCDLHHIFATTIVLGLRKGTQAFRASQDKVARFMERSIPHATEWQEDAKGWTKGAP
jgi:hypothetical protein